MARRGRHRTRRWRGESSDRHSVVRSEPGGIWGNRFSGALPRITCANHRRFAQPHPLTIPRCRLPPDTGFRTDDRPYHVGIGIECMSGTDADTEFAFSAHERDRLSNTSPADVRPAGSLSFSRNVFVPLTTACRYTCTYCTYFDPPGEATLMTREAVRDVLETGAAAGCTEALFTFGD